MTLTCDKRRTRRHEATKTTPEAGLYAQHAQSANTAARTTRVLRQNAPAVSLVRRRFARREVALRCEPCRSRGRLRGFPGGRLSAELGLGLCRLGGSRLDEGAADARCEQLPASLCIGTLTGGSRPTPLALTAVSALTSAGSSCRRADVLRSGAREACWGSLRSLRGTRTRRSLRSCASAESSPSTAPSTSSDR